MNIVAQNKPGIYEIKNTVNGNRYIGSAASIYSRWRVHLHHLRHGTSHCIHLQRAWNKYGESAFEFNVLKYCDKKDLIANEQKFIDTLNPEYNVQRVAGSSLGRKLSEETKEKLRKASTGHVHSAEQRAKISAWSSARKHSEETKAKMRKANEYQSPEKIEKCRVSKIGNQWNVGKHHNQETKEKMSLAKKLYWALKKAGKKDAD